MRFRLIHNGEHHEVRSIDYSPLVGSLAVGEVVTAEEYDSVVALFEKTLNAKESAYEAAFVLKAESSALRSDRDRLKAERDALRAALAGVMAWVDNWDPPFIWDDEWPATRTDVDSALALSEEPK